LFWRRSKIRADYKLIAKAYGRIGSAYQKKGDLPSAIKFYEKSLTEHRTPDILNKLREVEKAKAEAERQAYIDPEKSAIAREEGNTLFKAGDFAGSVKSYTEAIKRDPSDPRGYNNRAAAYTKLAALPEALKDVNKAIEIDPSFGKSSVIPGKRSRLTPPSVKAYTRKANVLLSMREHTKALEAVQEAELHDTDHKNANEIRQLEFKIQQALYEQRGEETQEQTLERAMRDPEVAVSYDFMPWSRFHSWPLRVNDRTSCKTLWCSLFYNKLRAILKHYKTTWRTLLYDKRFKNWSTLGLSGQGEERRMDSDIKETCFCVVTCYTYHIFVQCYSHLDVAPRNRVLCPDVL